MAERNDGGSAFPAMVTFQQWDEDAGKYRDHVAPAGGMSLRDYFAAQAMAALVANHAHNAREGGAVDGLSGTEFLSRAAYGFADTMLKTRLL